MSAVCSLFLPVQFSILNRKTKDWPNSRVLRSQPTIFPQTAIWMGTVRQTLRSNWARISQPSYPRQKRSR